MIAVQMWSVIILGLSGLSDGSSNTPTLHGPGFDCRTAFDDEFITLETLLLCNKTSTGPGFNKTEIQTLDTSVVQLEDGNCEQFLGSGFRCIEHYQCLGDSTIITDGESQTQIVSRVTSVNVHTSVPGASYQYSYSVIDATDKKCETYTKVCCGPKEGSVTQKPFIDAVTKKTIDENPCDNEDATTILRCNFNKTQTEKIKPVTEPPRPEPPSDYVPKCGRHNPDGYQQSLVNLDEDLHESQFAEWPNMCAIMTKGVYTCGASLISPNFVLTAAHCFNSSTARADITVRCGDWDTLTGTELYQHQELAVQKIIIHPGFDTLRGRSGNLVNDIALIQTAQPFSLSPHVDTVCLPRPEQNFDGSLCAATGWGKDRFGDDGELQVILKEVWINVIDHKSCQEKLRKTKLGRFFILNKLFICAGGEGDIDMCTGDGGSPLMCEGPDGFVQAGIVSWGIGCGLNDVPGGYVNIGAYVCWIKSLVEEVEGSGYFPSTAGCDLDYSDYDIRNIQ